MPKSLIRKRLMDSIVSSYRQAYHDWIDRKISREEFWERVRELDLKQPELFNNDLKVRCFAGINLKIYGGKNVRSG